MKIEQVKTIIALKEMLEIKQKILGSYEKGELEAKRPEFYKRLTSDIKSLKLSIELLDGDFMSFESVKIQIKNMITRNNKIAEGEADAEEEIGTVSKQVRKEILDRDNEALKECLEVLDKFITE